MLPLDETTPPQEEQAVRRDDTYYFSDVIFQVESTLFKLPRHEFIANSEFFRALFSDLKQPDGLSDEQPVHLKEVLESDFRVLVKLLYPVRAYNGVTVSLEKEEWKSILKLSTLWEFSELRESAISHLGNMVTDPVEKVVMSKEYHVDKWLVPALNALAQRERAISYEEAEKLGFELAFKLSALREIPQVKAPLPHTAQSSPHMIYCTTCSYHVSCPSRSASSSYSILPLGANAVRGSYTMDYTNRIKADFGL